MDSAVDHRDHLKFLGHLDESEKAVWLVAQMLSKRGHKVSVPVTTKAETYGEWKDHADDGDLFIERPALRVEVKRRGCDFTDAGDWPYPDFMVCAQHSWDRASPKPYLYIILSKSGTHAASVFGSSSSSWNVEKRTDSRYENVRQPLYFCPMDKVSFFKVPTGTAPAV